MTDDTTPNEEFIGLLDEQAKDLLRRLNEEAKLEGEARLSVMDHVRGFAAVTNYVETRLKIAPPKAAKSRIEEMRERIDGSVPRRRSPRPNGRAPGGGGGTDEAAPAAPDPGPPPPV